MTLALLILVVLVVISVFVHYEALRLTSILMERLTLPPRSRLLVVIVIAFMAHVVQMLLFAGAYMAMVNYLDMGALIGDTTGLWREYIYFSAATYTTLGIGDLYPTGAMRLVAGFESLLGLVLIGWSTSFTYLAMRDFWDLHGRGGKKR